MTPLSPPIPEHPTPRAVAWDAAAPPAVTGSGSGLRWPLTGHSELFSMRREARARLTGTADPTSRGAGHEEAVERTVLALDELASNALRHGRPPVAAELFDRGDTWLVVVTDAAPAELPVPAVGRPGGLGGFGLYVVADFSVAHGIDVRDGHKRVWAELPKG